MSNGEAVNFNLCLELISTTRWEKKHIWSGCHDKAIIGWSSPSLDQLDRS